MNQASQTKSGSPASLGTDVSKKNPWREQDWQRGPGGKFGSYVGSQQEPQQQEQSYGYGYGGADASQNYGQAQGPLQEEFHPAFPELYGQETQQETPQEPGEFQMPSQEERDDLNYAPAGNLYLGDPPKPDRSLRIAQTVGIGALVALGVGLGVKGYKSHKFIGTMADDAQNAAKEIGRMGNSRKAARFTRQIESKVFRSGDKKLIQAFKDMENTGSLPPGRLSKARLAGLRGATKRDTIDNLTQEFHKSEVEFSVVLSPGNNIRYASRGGKGWGFIDGADGIGKEMDRMRNFKYRGVYTMYHNHPDNSGFSAADLDTMGRMGFGEMLASTPDGTIHRMTASKKLMDTPYAERMHAWDDVMPTSGERIGPEGVTSSRGPAKYSRKKIGSRTPAEAAGTGFRAARASYKEARKPTPPIQRVKTARRVVRRVTQGKQQT